MDGGWGHLLLLLTDRSIQPYVSPDDTPSLALPKQVYETVESIKSDYPSLRLGHGKCVYELRPDITWDKGKVRAAVRPGVVDCFAC